MKIHLFDHIPERLRKLRRWVNWKTVQRNGTTTRPPFCPKGQMTKTNEPGTWNTYKAAVHAYELGGFDGIGFVLGDGFVGIDLDNCRNADTGKIEPWAQAIIDLIDSYAEKSPSGSGVHILARGTLPKGRRKIGELEIYDADHYFTMTGDRLNACDVEERKAELTQFYTFFSAQHGAKNCTPPLREETDERLIQRARTARNGAKFSRLWKGEYSDYPSKSEADLALCSILAFWTGRDPERIDCLFRQSKLRSSKWECRADYRDRTIAKAINKPDTRDIRAAGNEAVEPIDQQHVDWQLHDLGAIETWQADPLQWDVEPLIPRGGIGFLSAAPKDGKSLLALDLSIHFAQAHEFAVEWLGRFPVSARRILYVAREDPIWRLKERAIEINKSYDFPPIPEGVVCFLIRERFQLTNAKHIDWLRKEVSRRQIDVLILDVLSRMVPDLDELSAKDMGAMVSILEPLNRDSVASGNPLYLRLRGEILERVSRKIGEYVELAEGDEARMLLALWCVGTYFHRVFRTYPLTGRSMFRREFWDAKFSAIHADTTTSFSQRTMLAECTNAEGDGAAHTYLYRSIPAIARCLRAGCITYRGASKGIKKAAEQFDCEVPSQNTPGQLDTDLQGVSGTFRTNGRSRPRILRSQRISAGIPSRLPDRLRLRGALDCAARDVPMLATSG